MDTSVKAIRQNLKDFWALIQTMNPHQRVTAIDTYHLLEQLAIEKEAADTVDDTDELDGEEVEGEAA